MFKRVTDFHRTFNQLIANQPEFPSSAIRQLRFQLLREEINEFCEAYEITDYVEIADALADICYIIAGTCVSYGICPDDRTFHSPYDVSTNVYKGTKLFFSLKLNRMMKEDFERYSIAELSNNLDNVKSELVLMIWNVCAIAYHYHMPLNEIFAEVHRSNMAKALPDGTVRYRDDGKVLKPDSWTPPDIKSILLNSGEYIEIDGVVCPKY